MDRDVNSPQRLSRTAPTITQVRKTTRRSRSLPTAHLVIGSVTPAVDGGRHPVKRVVGDVVRVSADIYKDGHDLVKARIAYRGPGEGEWTFAPMEYDYNADRWSGRFVVDRVGSWSYTVEAWPDGIGTWQSELRKKVEAGRDVSSELMEGAALIEHAARRIKGDGRKRLAEWGRKLRDSSLGSDDRVRIGLDGELVEIADERIDPDLVTRFDREMPLWVDRPSAAFAAWYEMFPRSQSATPGKHGTFADAQRALRRIAELGFDVVYLPPIHPVGKTMRKGRNNTLPAGPDDAGSPWAIGSDEGGHTAIDSRLGTMADFRAFVRECARLGMEVALDYALQCSPDHPWLKEHPEWFFVRPDGTIKYAENPPKQYQDIYPLDFWCEDRVSLWEACRDLFLFWIQEGVRVFRVDNPHTKPFAFWEWVLEELRRDHPDVILLSEAFTRPKRMKGLAKVGFTQSYTYFTWRNTSWELRDYLTELTATDMVDYFRPTFFTNTPDILHEYLQKGGRPAFRVRLLLAATLSPLYGIYSGFELCEDAAVHEGSEEYLHSEKYEIRVRDWNAAGNINADVGQINRIRKANPALQILDNLRFCTSENDAILFYHKHAVGNDLLIAVNLDPHSAQAGIVHVPLAELGISEDRPYHVEDLLTGARYEWRGPRNFVMLNPSTAPGHVLRVIRT